jgi:LysM repeat protein
MIRIVVPLFLAFVSILAACAPQPSTQTPLSVVTLQPFLTQEPSQTADRPEEVSTLEKPLPTATPFLYEVQAGDTLSGIALKFGVSLDDLVVANPDISPNSMSIGTTLRIPSNPTNLSGDSTPTPVPVPVKQVECYPSADQGMWCLVLIFNDTEGLLENFSAQVTLVDTDGDTLVSMTAISMLNILPPGSALPLMVFFPPVIPADARPIIQMLTGIRLLGDDARYLPASVNNTLVLVDGSGRAAQVTGQVHLPEQARPADLVWVAAVAYDGAGRVVGGRRWESSDGLAPGATLPFAFMVSSLAGEIERVEFAVEARP